MAEADIPRYQLGLSLSGAISAGAYSAGVLDFLLQALDAWENAAGDARTPKHEIGLKVMAGASAGAITAAVAALALAGDPDSRDFDADDLKPDAQHIKYRFRRLYDTWVVSPALVAETGTLDLLSVQDLEHLDLRSVLNSFLLDKIAKDALTFSGSPAAPRTYVSTTLHIYLTLSNLRGTPYSVDFVGGNYGMMQHGDRAHYVVSGIGQWPTGSDFADTDPRSATLDTARLFDPPENEDWNSYGTAALASAAFPVGLAPRLIETTPAAYAGRHWPIENYQALHDVKPAFPSPWITQVTGGFSFAAVDGGVIDNDPFEYALYSLLEKAQAERTSLQSADRGVIMIAPFPEPPAFPPDGVPDLGLLSAYMALMPALKQQVRFKPAALALAGNDHVGSRFMISPSRPLTIDLPDGGTAKMDAPFPIASGLLNGFGGFVSRAFRDHDFQLGRRNAQRFLQTNFRLADDNPIMQQGYAALDTTPLAQTGFPGLPIIPLLGDAAAPVPAPIWPRIHRAELDTILSRLRTRLDAVANKFLTSSTGNPLLKAAMPVAWILIRWPGGRLISRTFLADLVRRDQIVEWALPDDWPHGRYVAQDALIFKQNTHLVIGALLDPAFDLRSVTGLALTCHLTESRVEEVLNLCATADGKCYQVWRSGWTDSKDDRPGSPLVCLKSDRPAWIKQKLGRGHAGFLFFAPKFDPPQTPPPEGLGAVAKL